MKTRCEGAEQLAAEAEKPEIDPVTMTSSMLIDDNTDESVLEAMILPLRSLAVCAAACCRTDDEGNDDGDDYRHRRS